MQRSLICDLQRHKYYMIPNALFEILRKNSVLDFDQLILQASKEEHKSILREYEAFLLEYELIFCDDRPDLFPPLSLKWSIPFPIHNAIIEIDEKFEYAVKSIKELIDLGVQQMELRFYKSNPDILMEILSLFKDSNVNGLIIIYNNRKAWDRESLEFVLKMEKRIARVYLYNSESEDVVSFKVDETGADVIYLAANDLSSIHCGKVSPEYFAINIPHFTESQHYNTCLNRKISIDREGNIKNCPGMAKSYGHIKDTKLIDVVDDPGFQQVWFIKKDEIIKCKDCEFRYICTDCRAYLENPEDEYSAPLKCGYNPYTCEWTEWSNNPLKQQAIEYYGMQELVKQK